MAVSHMKGTTRDVTDNSRAASLKASLALSEALAKESAKILEGFSTHLNTLLESMDQVADRAHALTDAQKHVSEALQQTSEVLDHLDTPKKVEARIKLGPRTDPESFFTALTQLEECIDFLERHGNIRVAEEALSTALGLRKEAMTLCLDEFWVLMKRYARVPSIDKAAATGSRSPGMASTSAALFDRGEELMPEDAVERLHDLAEAMLRNNNNACFKVYIEVRKSVMEKTQLGILPPPMSKDEASRMSWPVAEKRIDKWVSLLGALQTLLPTEHRLAHANFDATRADVAFSSIITLEKNSAVHVAQGLMLMRRMPEKVFGMLEMGEKLTDCLPSVSRLLPTRMLEAWEALEGSLASEARASFQELRISYQRDVAKNTVGDGSVHPLAAQTVAFLKRLLTHRSAAAVLFQEQNSFEGASDARGKAREAEVLKESAAQLLNLLWSALVPISRSSKSKALAALFLMNNAHYLLKSVQGSPQLSILGKEWQEDYESKVEQHGTEYSEAAWQPLASLIKDDSAFSKKEGKLNWVQEKALIKEKFKAVNHAIEELKEVQCMWSVPDSALLANLRDAIVEDFLPTYKEFIQKYSVMPFSSHPDKYIRYTAEDMEAIIRESLFTMRAAIAVPSTPKGALSSIPSRITNISLH